MPAFSLPFFAIPRFYPAIVLAGSLVVATTSSSEEEPARRIGFILEGAFEDHEIGRTARGAERTLIVPFYEWDYGVRAFTREIWEERGLEWDDARGLALAIADGLVESVEPEIVRDDRGIIQYLILADESPFLTSTILSPKLLEAYRDLLGDRVFALPIDRNRIYLFPVTGGSLEDYGPSIVDEFRRARLPVSLEVFLLDDEGYRVVGELRREES